METNTSGFALVFTFNLPPLIPQLQPVESEAIMAMGYDAMEQVLYIQFRKTKRVYSYRGVNQQAFESLSNAKSLGQHFTKNILAHHTGVKA